MSFFFNTISSSRNKSFITDGEISYDYKDINKKIKKLKKNYKIEGLILNITKNTIDFLIGYLYFFETSKPQLLIDQQTGVKSILQLIRRFKPNYLFVPNNIKNEFNYKKIFEFGKYVLLKTNFGKIKINKNIAFLMPTSGSTGDQKFAKISFDNIKSNTKNIIKYLKLKNNDCTITTLQPSYSYGMSILNTHILAKSSIILTDKTLVQKEFWELYKKFPVTNFNGVPILYEFMIKFGLNNFDKDNLKFLTSAGGALDQKTLIEIIKFCEENKIKYYSMYGQTEASPRISYLLYPKYKNKIGSIGKVIQGGSLLIKKNEIIYKGSNIFGGYSNGRKDLKRFKKNGILKTGDIGYQDNDGFIFITGRSKRIAKLFGVRLNLDLIENNLKNKNIKCAIISIKSKVIIFHTNKTNNKKILKYLFEEFKIIKTNVEFKHIKQIPKTKNNKINYNELEKKLI